jgi:iron complex outermembrane recepter protein
MTECVCCGGIREATPQTTTPPASETPEPQTTPATPSVEPGASPLPPVTVEARRRRPARQVEPAAPARSTTPSAPRTTPTTTTPTAPSTPAQPTAVTTSPFQPTPALNTITNNQIQATQAQSFGNLFFTLPGATSAGLAPGASRPVLRGLDDFRVRVQENGIGSMDVSDLGQDHGVPIDPLSIQKVEIYRGPEALRFGSQALGGVVEATNNRIPFAAPLGGWQTQFKSATTTVDRGLEGGALFDAGTRHFAVHADFYGRHANDYFVPSYPYLFPTDPTPPFNGKQPNSGLHSEGQAVGGSHLFDGGYVGAAISRFTSVYRIPTLEGAQTNGRIDLAASKQAPSSTPNTRA